MTACFEAFLRVTQRRIERGLVERRADAERHGSSDSFPVIVRECQAGFEESSRIDERRPVVSAGRARRLEDDALAAAILRRGCP